MQIHHSYIFLSKIGVKLKLPFLIFCVSKTAFLQQLSKRKQLLREFLVTLEVSNLISGDSTGIFPSSNSVDEGDMLIQIEDTKHTHTHTKESISEINIFSNLFSIIQIKY